ncbi:MAG: helix-turn-helix transcriptional regulator [Clostridiales bacterium]|nr:helix-turn-helix transcriptional regulator [Clostridiales bacterium]
MNVKIERIKKGLSQRQLAKLCGVCQNTIVKIEKGEIDTVIVQNLKKVAEVLGVGMVELFFNDEQ